MSVIKSVFEELSEKRLWFKSRLHSLQVMPETYPEDQFNVL